ncbi:MAG: hypothetical protein CL927_17870 [Deltaproteobacteria bacterium]|nr:hypothetical protein [Deltaproteobacteria bacterium]
MQGLRRALLLGVVGGCTPTGPPVPLKDTGVRQLLDSATSPEDLCRPTLDPTVVFVRTAQQLPGAGPFFVCPSIPFTATGDDARVYVSAFAAATVTGKDTVTWALAGAQAHASGVRAVIVAEEQAMVSVALSSSGIQRCAEILWNETWNAGCD